LAPNAARSLPVTRRPAACGAQPTRTGYWEELIHLFLAVKRLEIAKATERARDYPADIGW